MNDGDKLHVHIDSSEISKDVPQTDHCPKCGTKDLGGGIRSGWRWIWGLHVLRNMWRRRHQVTG
jgi:hypothetical protein